MIYNWLWLKTPNSKPIIEMDLKKVMVTIMC
jgi:hypothetical protein